MLDGGYIKLHRKLTKWEWYHNANTFRVFIHLLLTANYEPKRFEGKVIDIGQRATSISKLSKELKLSVQSIRTALNHLKSTGELTIATTSKYTIITINNYVSYQQLTNTLTNDQQTANKRLTNDQQQWKKDKESKRKIKKDKEERDTPTRNAYGEFENVFLSDQEFENLKERYPLAFGGKIERLSRYLVNKGKNFQNHYATLLNWLDEDTQNDNDNEIKAGKVKASYDINELEKIDTLDFIE